MTNDKNKELNDHKFTPSYDDLDREDDDLDEDNEDDDRPFPDSDEAINALMDDNDMMEKIIVEHCKELNSLREEVKAFHEERDAVRREVCFAKSGGGMWSYASRTAQYAAAYAETRGWDCFKEGRMK